MSEEKKRTKEETKRNFASEWLKKHEQKMRALQAEVENCIDTKIKMARQYMFTTASHAIKLYHQQNGTLPDLGLKLRQQMYYMWGLISRRGRKQIYARSPRMWT